MKLLIIRNLNKIKQLLDFPLYFGMKHKYDTTNDHNVEDQTWFENFCLLSRIKTTLCDKDL